MPSVRPGALTHGDSRALSTSSNLPSEARGVDIHLQYAVSPLCLYALHCGCALERALYVTCWLGPRPCSASCCAYV